MVLVLDLGAASPCAPTLVQSWRNFYTTMSDLTGQLSSSGPMFFSVAIRDVTAQAEPDPALGGLDELIVDVRAEAAATADPLRAAWLDGQAHGLGRAMFVLGRPDR